MAFTDRLGSRLRWRLPKAPSAYVGTHDATAFGLSCSQQPASLAIPNGLPQETLDYISGLFGSGATSIAAGENCEEAIGGAPHHMESNSDHNYRFETQRHCTCQRQT